MDIRSKYRELIAETFKNTISEGAADEATKAARLEAAKKTHAALQDAVAADRIVTIRARKQPRFEDPAMDVHILNHQGQLMLVDSRGIGRRIQSMIPSASGHVTVDFPEKGGRRTPSLHLHGGFGGEGDFIETEKEASPYRVALVGGKHQFRGLPDLSEDANYCYQCELENLLEFRLFPKRPSLAKKAGFGLAAAITGLGLGMLGGGSTSTPMSRSPARIAATQPAAAIGSGQAVAKTAQAAKRTPHELELAGPFIREREAFKEKAYQLGDKKTTIGYGTTVYSTGKPVQMGDTITREQADKEHDHYINTQIMPQMEKTKFWSGLDPHQKAAVISFSYNHGAYWHTKPEYQPLISALMNPQNKQGVHDAWHKYTNSPNPKLKQGLVNRANAELVLGGWADPVTPKAKRRD